VREPHGVAALATTSSD